MSRFSTIRPPAPPRLAPRTSGLLDHIEPVADVPFLYDAPACSPPSRAEGPPDAHWADGTQSCLPCALTPGSGRAPPVNEASAVQEAAPRRPENHYALRPGPGVPGQPRHLHRRGAAGLVAAAVSAIAGAAAWWRRASATPTRSLPSTVAPSPVRSPRPRSVML